MIAPVLRFASFNRPAMQFAAQVPATDKLSEIGREYPVVGTMLDLIRIPSSTPQADPKFKDAIDGQMNNMRQLLVEKFTALGVTDIIHDPHGSLIVRLPGSAGLENKRPLLLTAHMDIVAGDEKDPTKAVNPRLMTKADGSQWIATDETTTLGSDDKGGLAMILDNVARLQGKHPLQNTPLPHAPLELLFSPDEESTLESLKKLDTSQLKAKHVLVVDEFSSFKVTTGLASAVPIKVLVSGFPGGHSGEDINKNRPNAMMALLNLVKRLGTGVIAMKPDNSIPEISKNFALFNGGRAPNAIPESADATFFLRSSDKKAQDEHLAWIEKLAKNAQRYYKGHGAPGAQFSVKSHEEYPGWQGNDKTPIKDWAIAASKAMDGPAVTSGPIHAAAQASILANKQNAYGEAFDAVLIGPDIEEAHTVRERINWQTLIKANQWLGNILQEYSRQPE